MYWLKREKGSLLITKRKREGESLAGFDDTHMHLSTCWEGTHLAYSFEHGFGSDEPEKIEAFAEELLSMSQKDLENYLYEKSMAQTDFEGLSHTFLESKLKGASNGYDFLTLADGTKKMVGHVYQYEEKRVHYVLVRGAYLGAFSESNYREELNEVLRRGTEGLEPRIYIGARAFAEAWLKQYSNKS